MKALRKVWSAVILILSAGFYTPALALTPLPVTITNNTSAMVLYFTGWMEAQEQINARVAEGGPQRFTFAEVAQMNRSLADVFKGISPHAMAYFWGRINAFEEAAILYDTPTTG